MKTAPLLCTCLGLLVSSLFTTTQGLQAVELQPIRHRKLKIKAHVNSDHSIADIEAVSFYITRDNGAQWLAIDSSRIKRPADAVPYFIFESQGDGSYGFWTQVRYRDGSGDNAPQVGTLPLPGGNKLIDTTAPAIHSFYAGLLTGTATKLVVEWKVSDLHLRRNSVDIEYSSDLENWTLLIQDQVAKGSYIGSMPAGVSSCYLRLSVSDRAQNTAQSETVHIGNNKVGNKVDTHSADKNTATPTASDPRPKAATTTKSEIAGQLPSLAEVGAAVTKELAHTDASNKPLPAKKFEIPAGHQDIIAPYANKPWPQEAQDSQRAPGESLTAIDRNAHLNSRTISPEIARILQNRKGRLIFGSDAEKILTAARTAVTRGQTNHALVLYQRLRDSTVTNDALPEEVALLIGLKRLNDAMDVIKSAPPEAINTTLRVQEAQIYITHNKISSAIGILNAIIPDNTDAYKNSRLVLARAYISSNKIKLAQPLLIDLSAHNDTWGKSAKQLLKTLK